MPRESFHDRVVARGGLAALLPDDHPMQAWNNEYNKWCRNFVNFVLVPSAIAMWLAGWGRGGRPDGGGPAVVAAGLYKEGIAAYENGDDRKAEELFERAVAADAGHAFAWANLGNLLKERGELQRAVKCHERAYQLAPSRPRASYNLAVSLQTAGSYEAAAIMYRKAIELVEQGLGNLTLSRVHSNLGVCLQGLGQLEEAAEQYALAKKHEPELRSANLNYCNIMLPLKGSEAAVGCFSSLLSRDPEFEQVPLHEPPRCRTRCPRVRILQQPWH